MAFPHEQICFVVVGDDAPLLLYPNSQPQRRVIKWDAELSRALTQLVQTAHACARRKKLEDMANDVGREGLDGFWRFDETRTRRNAPAAKARACETEFA